MNYYVNHEPVTAIDHRSLCVTCKYVNYQGPDFQNLSPMILVLLFHSHVHTLTSTCLGPR